MSARYRRQNDGARPLFITNVGVWFPGIDEHGLLIGQLHEIVADHELRVGAVRLDQHMEMRMRVAHERAVHVEQSDTAEGSWVMRSAVDIYITAQCSSLMRERRAFVSLPILA